MKKLADKHIAILLCDGFEESEMVSPRKALERAGATTYLISPAKNKVRGWKHDRWTKYYAVDEKLENADPQDYDAILLPGGVINPDKLRTYKEAVNFVNHFFKKKKLIAAICHGPLTLIETKNLKNKTLTSYHSVKTDLTNAGAKWKDKEVVIDNHLITSRSPKDLVAFNKAIITYLADE